MFKTKKGVVAKAMALVSLMGAFVGIGKVADGPMYKIQPGTSQGPVGRRNKQHGKSSFKQNQRKGL